MIFCTGGSNLFQYCAMIDCYVCVYIVVTDTCFYIDLLLRFAAKNRRTAISRGKYGCNRIYHVGMGEYYTQLTLLNRVTVNYACNIGCVLFCVGNK